MYRIAMDKSGNPARIGAFYTAISTGVNVVRCSDLDELKRIIAFLNAEPHGFIVGPAEKLGSITPKNRHEDDRDIDFYDADKSDVIQHMALDGESVLGVYLLPSYN